MTAPVTIKEFKEYAKQISAIAENDGLTVPDWLVVVRICKTTAEIAILWDAMEKGKKADE